MTIVVPSSSLSAGTGLTYLQLAQRLRRKCRVSGNGPSAITGQTEEYNRLLDWVNEAWMEIQRMRTDWLFMNAAAWCPTSEGQVSYDASADFGLTDFGYWALDYANGDTFRNYANPAFTFDIANSKLQLSGHGLDNGDVVIGGTTGSFPTGIAAGTRYYVVNSTASDFQVSATSGGTALTLTGTDSGVHTLSSSNITTFVGLRSETPMEVRDYDQWRNEFQLGSLRQSYSRPWTVARTPDNRLACGPITAAGYTLIGEYYYAPTEFTNATDVPALPAQYQMAIVYRAMMFYGVSEAAPEIYDEGHSAFEQIIRQILSTQTRRPRLAGALC